MYQYIEVVNSKKNLNNVERIYTDHEFRNVVANIIDLSIFYQYPKSLAPENIGRNIKETKSKQIMG